MNIDEIIDKVYKPSLINLKSFEEKTKLNPKIWINNKMNPKVRKQLILIAKEFIKSTDIKFIPIDIIMVGSLASYNWSKYSDIDLHIYCDFKSINSDTTLIKNYFDSKKNDWNNTHEDLNIYGYDVELYVLDINEVNTSNGIYSIKDNHWIKFPEYLNILIKSQDIKQSALHYIKKIDYYQHKFETLTDISLYKLLLAKCDWLYNSIRNGRRDSLAKDGEYAPGNIVFKVLRRTGHLELLRTLRHKIFDKLNSITENYLTEGLVTLGVTPIDTISNAFAACVTHALYPVNKWGFREVNYNKSGLDASEFKVISNVLKAISTKKKITTDLIIDKVGSGKYAYISPFIYDKGDQYKKGGYIGFTIYVNNTEIGLREGYVTVKPIANYVLKYTNTFDAYLIPIKKFKSIIVNVKWPDADMFTNVSDKTKFITELNKCLNI